MIKILFVCTGNICRSPTAEGVFQHLIEKVELHEHFYLDSAGTAPGQIGCAPDRRSQQTAMQHGVDLSGLRAREIDASDFKEFDYLLAMTRGHRRELEEICPPDLRGKIYLFTQFVQGSGSPDVPDPYLGEDGFEEVFQTISTGAAALLSYLRNKHKF